jgi:hypothetical protein
MPPFPSVPLVSMLYEYVCVIGLVKSSKYMPIFIFSAFGIIIIIFFYSRELKKWMPKSWMGANPIRGSSRVSRYGLDGLPIARPPLLGSLPGNMLRDEGVGGSDSLSGLCCLRHVADF